jgi:tetratricopeptide (TPR) repeat protein
MMEEGHRSLDMGYYVVALQIFQRVLGLRPDKYDAWYLSGLSKYHLEDYAGAESDCSHAIELNPFVVDIYETRAMSRLRTEKYDSAIADFTHAIEVNPDNSSYWFNRAYCYAQEHAFSIALQQLDYIQKRWPKLEEARNLRQTILATQRLRRREEGK